MSASRLCRILVLLSACAVAQSPKPVGELFASDASVQGAVTLTGTGAAVLSGSSVAAGEAAARLRLARGGEVRICPRTTVSIAASPNGRDLMLGMSAGSIESQYALAASADSIMTPDFRILLPGPGNFHFTVGADSRGNTCIRTLQYNTASLIVSELMGDATYQVKPSEEVLFRKGKISDRVSEAGVCGCAAPAPLVRANAAPPSSRTVSTLVALQGPAPGPADASLTAPPPPIKPQDVHVEVDAPFVFRATDPLPELELPPTLATLRTARLPFFAPVVLPPAPPRPATPAAAALRAPVPGPKPKGFFGKVKSFFGKIFH